MYGTTRKPLFSRSHFWHETAWIDAAQMRELPRSSLRDSGVGGPTMAGSDSRPCDCRTMGYRSIRRRPHAAGSSAGRSGSSSCAKRRDESDRDSPGSGRTAACSDQVGVHATEMRTSLKEGGLLATIGIGIPYRVRNSRPDDGRLERHRLAEELCDEGILFGDAKQAREALVTDWRRLQPSLSIYSFSKP